jgi:hypothetical protein
MWIVKTEGLTSFLNCEHMLNNFLMILQHSDFCEVISIPTMNHSTYEGGSKSFRPDIQKPCQRENAARDI